MLVVRLIERAETGTALADFALRSGLSPMTYYRFVQRVTVHSWRGVRERGVEWVKESAGGMWRPFVEVNDAE